MSFLNALLVGLGILGVGYGLYLFLYYREPRKDPADPEQDDCNWIDPEDHENLWRTPK